MNPYETFAPPGVAYNPRRTPTTAPSGPEPCAKVLLDETDSAGTITVVVYKETAESDIGLCLKHVPGIGLLLDEFSNGSILVSTKLRPTMSVLSINDCDCSGMSVEEAMLLIWSTVGQLSIQAQHSQVLLFQTPGNSYNANTTALVQATLDNTTAAATTTDTHASNGVHTAALTVAQQPQSAGERSRATSPTPPTTGTKVKVVIQKSSKSSKLGLKLGNETTGGQATVPVIVHIDADGLCANTALQVGMRIWSVNGLRCYNKEDTMTKLKRAKTACHIEAEQIMVLEEGDNEAHMNNARSSSRGRSIVRSLSPKKWLPSFQRRNSKGSAAAATAAEAPLLPAQGGDFA